MGERGSGVTYRSSLSIGIHLGLAVLTTLASLAPTLDDPSQWDIVRWILVGAAGYAALALRQRVVLSSWGIRVHGMLLSARVSWPDLRSVDIAPYEPALIQGSSLSFAHQLVLHTQSGRWIEATCCPGSLHRLRRMQAEVITRAELRQPRSDPSRGGRHRPRPELPTQGASAPDEQIPQP